MKKNQPKKKKKKGYVGEYINFISEYDNSLKELNPCIINKGKIDVEWTSHEDLDNWHINNIDSYQDAYSLIRSFHRAYQMKGEICSQCPLGN